MRGPYTRAFTLQSIMSLTKLIATVTAFLSLQSNPRLVSTWAHKDTDIKRWKDQTLVKGTLALTGYSPAVVISVNGTTCLSIASLDIEWQYAAACFRPSLPSKSAYSYTAANLALPNQCFSADRLCLTLGLAYLTPKCQIPRLEGVGLEKSCCRVQRRLSRCCCFLSWGRTMRRRHKEH